MCHTHYPVHAPLLSLPSFLFKLAHCLFLLSDHLLVGTAYAYGRPPWQILEPQLSYRHHDPCYIAHSNIKEHYSSLIMMSSGHLHDVVLLPVLP
jgi:hypothetical protein